VWCVPLEQADAYQRAGARHILTGPAGKAAKMNEVLDAHPDEWCVFSDDDCRKMTWLNDSGGLVKCTLGLAASDYIAVGNRRRDHLVAIPNMSNAHFAARRVSDWGSTVGWFCAVAPNTECRFDEALPYGEDIDFACRVFDRYGRIARVGWIIGDYRYGGPESHFRAQHENRAALNRALIERWPGLLEWKSPEVLGYRRLK
jgi:hypothetical protein